MAEELFKFSHLLRGRSDFLVIGLDLPYMPVVAARVCQQPRPSASVCRRALIERPDPCLQWADPAARLMHELGSTNEHATCGCRSTALANERSAEKRDAC